MTRLRMLALVTVFVLALGWRGWDLGRYPLWADEAESCINALTILDHGYPTDHYLGIPLYENTLIRTWPESEEYEFRDLSYSSKGMAIYHGWLPLYSIAAAFWLTRVRPDRPSDRIEFRHSVSEMVFRNKVARWPALAFSLVFLVALFVGGKAIFDEAAGWAALLLGGFSHLYIWYGGQARYYSATLALSTLCLVMTWLMLQRGKWHHFLIGAASFVLLFHTHMVSWLSALIVALALAPQLFRHRHGALKLAVFGAIIVAGTVPWLILTGFLGEANGIPKAWTLLQLPGAILSPLFRRHNLSLPLAIGAAWLFLGYLFRDRLSARFTKPLLSWSPALLFLTSWLAVSFLTFTFLIPAASYFYFRLVLGLVAPAILIASAVFSALGHLISPRRTAIACVICVAVYFSLWGDFRIDSSALRMKRSDIVELIDYLRAKDLKPGTRIYSTPTQNLILTFYSGVPIQSVAPVRKSFLENYPGDVVIIESFRRYNAPPLEPEEIVKIAREVGQKVDNVEAAKVSRKLRRLVTAAYAMDRGALVTRAVPRLDPAFQRLAASQRLRQEAYMRENYKDPGLHLMTRGFSMPDFSAWWQLFFYRFSEPHKRVGPNLNYASRIEGSKADVLPSCWVVFDSPGDQTKRIANLVLSQQVDGLEIPTLFSGSKSVKAVNKTPEKRLPHQVAYGYKTDGRKPAPQKTTSQPPEQLGVRVGERVSSPAFGGF